MWPWLGIDHLDASGVKDWMLGNLDRIDIFVPDGYPMVLASLDTDTTRSRWKRFPGAAQHPAVRRR